MSKKQLNFCWEYLENKQILIYKQINEDENTYNCISQIIEQLKKENKDFTFIIN